MTRMVPLSCESGITMFSRASDSGTSSITDGGNLDLAQLDERQAVLLGLRLHDVVGAGIAQLDQRLLDRRAVHPVRFLELIRPDNAAPDQDFGPIPSLRHGCTLSRIVDAMPP